MFLHENTKINEDLKLENVSALLEDTDEMNKIEKRYEGLTFSETQLQIELESERFFSGLNMSMVLAEHTAIVNENAELLNEASADYFQKVKDFFETLVRKVKEFFKKIGGVLKKLGGKVKNALNKVKDVASGIKFKFKSTAYENVINGSFSVPDFKIPSKLTAFDKERIDSKRALEELGFKKLENAGAIKDEMLGKQRSDLDINSGMIKNAQKVLDKFDAFTKKIETYEKATNQVLDRALKIANKGLSVKKGEEATKYKILLDNSKMISSTLNTLTSSATKAVVTATNNAYAIINAGVKATKVERPGRGGDKKKNESGILSTFGFETE